MPVIGAAFADDVYDSARAVSKLGLVTPGEHLEFKNGVLVELRRRSTVHFIAIGHPIDQEDGVASALPQNGSRTVESWILLAIDGYSGN